MSATITARPRITADIRATLELDPNAWEALPPLPEHLGVPDIRWDFDEGRVTTIVTLIIDGDEELVSFWDTDHEGVCNTVQNALDDEDRALWRGLGPDVFAAAIAWGKEVHVRICAGAELLAVAVAPYGSEAYEAVVAYATNTQPPEDERTPKEMSLFRAAEALAVTGGLTGSPQDDLQILMCDFLHLAKEAGLDVHLALRNAGYTFQLEHNDPDFANS